MTREVYYNSMQEDFEAVKNSALRLIKFRMRSRYELQRRLERKHYPLKIIKQVLDLLSDLRYVDDVTFAKTWVKSRLQFRPRSRKLLSFELKMKGIEESIIERSLTLLNPEIEEQMARQLAVSRVAKLKRVTKETKKRRLSGYLARRGFSTSLSLKIINELEK